MFDASGAANWIEIAWLAEGIVGALVSTYAIWDALRDRYALKRAHKNGDMKLVADSNLRTEIIRMAMNAMVVTVGVYAVRLSPSPYPKTGIGWALTVLLLMIPFCTVINSFIDGLVRRKMLSGHVGHR